MKNPSKYNLLPGLSQESLKLLACVTMLLDHIGVIFFPGSVLRIIGRVSFPIFCFLLAEGFFHTRNKRRYALRLAVSMLLAEIPFDLAFFRRIYWGHQNVMLTLLLGYLAIWAVTEAGSAMAKALFAAAFAVAAEYLHSDYGGTGVLLILVFALTREAQGRNWIRGFLMLVLFAEMSSAAIVRAGGFVITRQMLGAAAMFPIALYSGEKKISSKAVQLAFYLFYPVHLAALWLLA